MSRLILHIGTPKTGSTALQHYLSANARVFSERNVLYPEFPPQFPKYAFAVARANGAFLRLLTAGIIAYGDARSLTKHHDESFHVLQGALSGSGTVVLSDELLWRFDYRRWMEALGIVRELGASEVDFVVYLRRQDLLCSSWWRNDASKGEHMAFQGFKELLATEHRMVDYYGKLQQLEGAIEDLKVPGRIIVRPYDPRRFVLGSLERDFTAHLGLPCEGTLIGGRINESLSFDVVEAIRRMSFKIGRPVIMTQIMPRAQRLSRRHPDAHGMSAFDYEGALEYVDRFREGNERISEKYLSGAPLFDEPEAERPVWIPNERKIRRYMRYLKRALWMDRSIEVVKEKVGMAQGES